jgi:fimbrial chaperone protein
MMTTRLVPCAVLAAAVMLPPLASAATISVAPVRVTLSGAERTAVVTVFNRGEDHAVIQAEALQWQQQDGEDQLSATREVLVSPPVFDLPGGKSQLVRLSLRREPDGVRELSYRLILQEVPSSQEVVPQGLRIALRLSLPVFVVPDETAAPALAWSAICCEGRALTLELTNKGTRHLRLTDFTLAAPGVDDPIASQMLAAYVLPGRSKRWVLETRPATIAADIDRQILLTGHTEDGPVSAEIPVAQR